MRRKRPKHGHVSQHRLGQGAHLPGDSSEGEPEDKAAQGEARRQAQEENLEELRSICRFVFCELQADVARYGLATRSGWPTATHHDGGKGNDCRDDTDNDADTNPDAEAGAEAEALPMPRQMRGSLHFDPDGDRFTVYTRVANLLDDGVEVGLDPAGRDDPGEQHDADQVGDAHEVSSRPARASVTALGTPWSASAADSADSAAAVELADALRLAVEAKHGTGLVGPGLDGAIWGMATTYIPLLVAHLYGKMDQLADRRLRSKRPWSEPQFFNQFRQRIEAALEAAAGGLGIPDTRIAEAALRAKKDLFPPHAPCPAPGGEGSAEEPRNCRS